MNSFQHAMYYGLWVGWLFSCQALLSMLPPAQSGVGSVLQAAVELLLLLWILRATLSSTLAYRFQVCQNKMRFLQGYTYIILLYFFASIISCGAKIVLLKWFFPDYLPHMLQQVQDFWAQPQFSQVQEQHELMLEQMKQVLRPVSYSLYWCWIDVMISFLVGLPVAWLANLKKWKMNKL